MKQLTLFIALFLAFSSRAQMIPLFEAGVGAPQSINDGFQSLSFGADESEGHFTICGTDSDSISVLFYNQTPSGADFWITRRIPQMEDYALIELFSDITLPTNSDFSYLVSTDSTAWTPLNAAANTPETVDNTAGNQFLRLHVRLNDSDSVRFTYRYVSVLADTNSFVGMPQIGDGQFAVGTSPSGLSIFTGNTGEYHVTVYDISGTPVFETSATGSQQFPLEMENGIYVVGLRGDGNETVKKCYLYR
jgi:hypothetical protein